MRSHILLHSNKFLVNKLKIENGFKISLKRNEIIDRIRKFLF